MPIFSSPIRHVVVLMLENHSFDHMLGYAVYPWSYLARYSNRARPLDAASPAYNVHPGADYSLNPGPLHALADVNMQLFGVVNPTPESSPAMTGFVYSYENPGIRQSAGSGQDLMACYIPQQVPALSTLASYFTVCTNWFASVPGPTAPNRLFANCATSGGYAGGGYEYCARTAPGSEGVACVPTSLHGLPSLFESIEAMGDDQLTWSIYHEDEAFAPELVLDVVQQSSYKDADPEFRKFKSDVEAQKLANYVFLTPSLWVDSQHPACDIRAGEWLIAEVYDCLRRSDIWTSTLLVVTYDEHGGFFDHVPPTAMVPNPDGQEWSSACPGDWYFSGPSFDFTRLGVRVPAVLVSAYTPRQLDSTQYEHASIPATIKKLFNLRTFLTQRDTNARTFETCIALGSPRLDAPRELPRPYKPPHHPRAQPDITQLDEAKRRASALVRRT